ncbi:PREDICTED: SET and MYND domain-containing protein 4-like [Nicrophorus vespilloides]|uniref:Protein-lysine N-methyltransferase SMYD4 n=1 Tax=Nicrophorus vespilloides TaxID=110193 RepID=A0ABM1MVR8_NICVS|nr:PREDICTED: SET and MYND domain-containing protein 4-like [Nicrophorus vespilloides]
MSSNRFHDNAYMSICSEKTLQSNEKGFFMQFYESVAATAGEDWIKNVFGKLKSDRERIRIIYDDPKIRETVFSTLCYVQEIYRKKSAEVAQARRFDAQKAVTNGNQMKGLMLYSQSVLRAPKTGENPKIDDGFSLVLALWERSELLMRLNYHSLALRDIQFAIKEGLDSDLKGEAFERMAVCYKAKGEMKRSSVSAELARKLYADDPDKIKRLNENLNKEYKEVTKICRRRKPEIPDRHPNFPQATRKMQVKQEVGKGRYVVASEPISTGETIVCEPPYAACLVPDCFGTHCHHCMDRLESPVGCPDCASVAFCKAECRDEAMATYHKFECKFLDLLIGSGMSILSHTSLRMVTQNTPERMYAINKDRSLERIYSLCSLAENRASDDFLQRTLMAAFLLRCLQKSGYFGYVDEDVYPNDNQMAVGELLLFHLQMLQFNAHEIYETKHKEGHKFQNAVASYVGVAIYPTVALFNHDCYPGVSRHFVGKNIVINALRPLNPGELIAENYGPIFTRRTLADRQKSLSGRYWFPCGCQACNQDWPMIDGLGNSSRRIRCPTKKCTYLFTLPIPNENMKCPRCKKKVSMTDNVMQMKICEEQYVAGFEYMEKQEVDKGIEVLCRAVDTFHRVSAPPHRETHLGQESLRTMMADYGNVYEIADIAA